MRLFISLIWLAACADDNLPRLKVEVNLVNIAFTVRGADGRLAVDLNRDDFEVIEDGVPQRVSFFARSADLPLSLALIADMSGSQGHFLKRHHHDLTVFLRDGLFPRDRALLVCFGNHLRLASDLSFSGQALIDALERFEHGDHRLPELGPLEDRDLGTAFYDALYYMVNEKLAAVERCRRAIIVFSDGEDNSSEHHMLDAIEAAQAENVRVFAMRYTQREHGRLTARNKYGMRVMARIARETGGIDFDAGESDVGAIFRQIGEELRSSYELAYVSTNAVRDGSFRKVLVRSRQAGYSVRTKTGYFAR
jgi:Ca-activated chloride channel family protein